MANAMRRREWVGFEVGRMNRRVELQTTTRTVDDDGGFTEVWASVITVWADFEPPAAHNVERVLGGEVQALIGAVVRMRYYAGVSSTWRLVEGTRIFDVRGVRDVENRHQWMELAVEERTP